jgi:hypothetical protein
MGIAYMPGKVPESVREWKNRLKNESRCLDSKVRLG